MFKFVPKIAGAGLMVCVLASCGGGGGGASSGLSPSASGGTTTPATGGSTTTGGTTGSTAPDTGTGLGISGSGAPIAIGTIDGFGSIFVNGVEFDTTNAEIFIDGQLATEDDLGVGMVVTVQGTINPDGVTGVAEVVIFDDEVKGPIENIVLSASGDTATITVLGVDIIIERLATVFEDTTFDTLAVGDVVEISGFPEGIAQLRATRVEKKTPFVPGETAVKVKGTVTDLTESTFNLGNYSVDYSSANLSEVTDGTLVDGMYVEVKGTLTDNTIVATEIETEEGIESQFEDDDDFKVQGTISNYVSNADFEVNGVKIDASNATLKPTSLILEDGVVIEVEGVWSDSVLVATKIEGRRGKVKVEGAVGDLSVDSKSLVIRLYNGNVTLMVDSRTMYDDDTDAVERLAFSDLAIGDFLEIEAYDDGANLIATRIDRDDADDEKLQGPVESFNPSLDITVLGITYSTEGAKFEGRNGGSVDAATFYADLAIGDIVEIKDREQADGIADEVELDRDYFGEYGGGDDDDDDDSSDDDSSDDDKCDDGDKCDDSSDDDSSDDDKCDDGDKCDDSSDDDSTDGDGSDDTCDDTDTTCDDDTSDTGPI